MTVLLIAAIAGAVGGVLGYFMRRDPGRLTRGERAELESLRSMREELLVKSSEHAVLGDQFAVIASGIIHKNRSDS